MTIESRPYIYLSNHSDFMSKTSTPILNSRERMLRLLSRPCYYISVYFYTFHVRMYSASFESNKWYIWIPEKCSLLPSAYPFGTFKYIWMCLEIYSIINELFNCHLAYIVYVSLDKPNQYFSNCSAIWSCNKPFEPLLNSQSSHSRG